jgi:serine/threonine-protein kinase HipA
VQSNWCPKTGSPISTSPPLWNSQMATSRRCCANCAWTRTAGSNRPVPVAGTSRSPGHRASSRCTVLPTWARPVGRIPTTHIFKPALAGVVDHDINEHVCLRAAALLGLAAARSTLTEFGDQRAVVVERFDRRRNGHGDLERVHQEDMCQALGMTPTLKYQRDGGPTPAQIVELIRNAAGPSAEADVERFVRALVFNWVIGGTDAHAKNYGMLLQGPNSRLTPLYDVATAVVLDGWNPHKWEMAMKIDRKGKFKYITRGDWQWCARTLRVPFEFVVEAAHTYAGNIGDALSTAADERIRALNPQLVARLIDRVAGHASDAVRRLQPL